jgi:hypothetical protein
MSLPFQEEFVSSGVFLRKFSSKVNRQELMWHRDGEDRMIEVIASNGWKLQVDNNLPCELFPGDKYLIKRGDWHRVIAGSGDLLLSIQKMENDDG